MAAACVLVSAIEVFEGVLREWGYDPRAWYGSGAERERVADCVNGALKVVWRRAFWPMVLELTRVQFRPTWEDDAAYVEGDEVFYNGVYWRCLADCYGVMPGEGEAGLARTWGVASDMVLGFRFCDYGVDEVDLEAALFGANPEFVADARVFRLVRTGYGAACVAREGVPVRPFLRFRPMPPVLSWCDWVVERSYSAGAVVFWGCDCWRALRPNVGVEPGRNPVVWAPVGVPEVFRDFVVFHAGAQRLQDEDGRAKGFEKAQGELNRLMDVYVDSTREGKRALFRPGV